MCVTCYRSHVIAVCQTAFVSCSGGDMQVLFDRLAKADGFVCERRLTLWLRQLLYALKALADW